MGAHQRRIEEARARNLEYIRRLDEQEADNAANEFLQQHVFGGGAGAGARAGSGDSHKREEPLRDGANRDEASQSKNTSVYLTGLTTYMACKQLEGVCAKIGKVRRIKIYKDARGGLKGDALVTFASHGMMARAIEKLNHFEIKPGVLLTATEAKFNPANQPSKATSHGGKEEEVATGEKETKSKPERLFDAEIVQQKTTGIVQDKGEELAVPSQDTQPDGNGAVVVSAAATSSAASTEPLSLPSRSVILKNVWDPLAAQENAAQFFSELEDDMKIECGKHGPIEHVHIFPTGAVLVRYASLASAIKCLQVMHNRWFDGRQLHALFDPSTPEEPADDDMKLDAFLASL